MTQPIPPFYIEPERPEADGERVVWILRIPTDTTLFEGHFPGLPIAPGALLVYWMECAWREGPGRHATGARWRRLRFLKEVEPGMVLTITVEGQCNGEANARIEAAGERVASGLLKPW